MRKTLLVTLDYPPSVGGVASYWQRVTASMPSDSWRVLAGQSLLSRWIWPRWLPLIWRMWRVAKVEHCEIIVAGQLLPVGTAAYFLYRITGIPYAVQVYGMDLAQASRVSRKMRLASLVLANAHAVIANSRATAEQAMKLGAAKERLEVVYPIPEIAPASPMSISRLRQKFDLADKRVVLTLGRLVPRKGQDKTIQAMRLVAKTHPAAVYVVAGIGPDRERLQRLADDSHEKVLFAGSVSDEEKWAWYELADVFVMPARSDVDDVEGFGMVYLEAGASGKPVVAGNTGGVREAVRDGETGLLVDALSAESIATAITRLLSNPDEARRLGDNGREAMRRHWSWEKEVEKLKRVLL